MVRWRTVVVVAVVCSAGCAGADFGSAESDANPPPGVSTEGVDIEPLIQAHKRSLSDTGVVIETTATQWDTVAGDNRTVTTRTKIGPNGTLRRSQRTETDVTTWQTERWDVGTTAHRYFPATGRTAIVTPMTEPTARYGTAKLKRWLTGGAYTVSVTDSPAGTRYVLTATAYDPSEPLEADRMLYDGRVIVTGSGRILGASIMRRTTEYNKWGKQVRSQSYTYRVINTGPISVSPPPWHGQRTPEEQVDG
jgi:hypothetical protein